MRTFLAILVLVSLFSVGAGREPARSGAPDSEPPDTAQRKPNILFFYADDLGYGDLACYGSELAQSPRLDRLAEEGVRFTQFYVSHCVCSPTRTTAITGHFPGRHRIYGHLSFFRSNRARKMPDWLDVNAPSFPRALQAAGYRTAMIGKWHLGGGSGRTFQIADLKKPYVPHPERTEVVINHPFAPAVVDYGFHYARTTIGNSPTWKDGKPWPEPHEVYPYMSDAWLTWSSRAIADDTIAFLERHARGHGDDPFYINAWFKDVHTPFKPTEAMLEPFVHLEGKARVHYAMVRFMDEQIGRVLDTLDDLGLAENTLVLFSSDNGAGKGRGGSNGPLRGWKHSLYEGGIRVPLIARWPGGGVPAGRVDEESVLNLCDFVPTFSKLAGATMPDGYQSDGEDMIEALRGEPFDRSKLQFWHYPSTKPALAVRSGRWKLLTDLQGKNEELYDLDSDPAEARNVAEDQVEVARSLRKSLLDWYGELPISGMEAGAPGKK